jgi:hypothetical protein
MTLEFMSDKRHDQLMKAGEDCIEMMNIGVHPDSALKKVAEDCCMTDKEVTLVSAAVNNSKQLAHLQTADAADKDKPFTLTNAESVIGARSKADLDTLADSSEAKQDQPDAVEIAKKIAAANETYVEKRNYRKSASDDLDIIREAWGVKAEARPVCNDKNPYHEAGQWKVAAEQASEEATKARDEAYSCLDKVASAFTRLDAPSWAEFEKVAQNLEIEPLIVDAVYELAGLECPRHAKVASGRLFIDRKMSNLVELVKTANKAMQASSDWLAVKELNLAKVAQLHSKLAGDKGEGGGASRFLAPLAVGSAVGSALKGTQDSLADVVDMGGEAKDVFSATGGIDAVIPASEASLDQSSRQSITNSHSKATVEKLLKDTYIGKHDLPDIVEAYNKAMSVNPRFGDAEVAAFVRQDLATKGAIPLDLMIRASQAHSKNTGLEA